MEVKPGNVLISLSRIALSLSQRRNPHVTNRCSQVHGMLLLLCCKFLRKVRHLMERVCKPLKFRFYICLVIVIKFCRGRYFTNNRHFWNGITHNGTLYFFSYNTFFNYNLFIFFCCNGYSFVQFRSIFGALLTPTEEPAFAGFTNTG